MHQYSGDDAYDDEAVKLTWRVVRIASRRVLTTATHRLGHTCDDDEREGALRRSYASSAGGGGRASVGSSYGGGAQRMSWGGGLAEVLSCMKCYEVL